MACILSLYFGQTPAYLLLNQFQSTTLKSFLVQPFSSRFKRLNLSTYYYVCIILRTFVSSKWVFCRIKSEFIA